ncbi:MAG TPA: hypothetical protein VFM69_00505 [Pricia sp.]|nr:hypothetical protein [Pricia sp.]
MNTTIIAGSLDIVAAFTQAYVGNKIPPDIVLKYIASGMFGNKALEGALDMILAGLFFHFTIAFACVTVFFMVYPKFKILHHRIVLNSLIIALTAWSITHLVIIPLSKIGPQPFGFKSALTAIGILFLCVGLPIAYSARQFFKKKAHGI